MRLSGEVGWTLAAVVEEAYRRVGGLGNVTVVPTREMLDTFSTYDTIDLAERERNGQD